MMDMHKEYQRRISKVRQQLRDAKADSFIATAVENVRYLTGFRGHDSWAVILPKAVILITDSRYTEQARGECVGCRIIERKDGLVKTAAALLEKQSHIETVGIEDTCPLSLFKTLRKELPVQVMPTKNVIENVRLLKTDGEIQLLRKASRIAFDAMDWALGLLMPGMTERQLTALYEYRVSEYKAKVGFETIICFGPNGSRNHHQPGERKLRKNDTILIDFGVNYEGYISDMTRSYAFGKVSNFYRKVYQTVAKAQAAAIETICAGVKMADVDAAARKVIEDSGLPVYGHGTGHGIGLQVHENPYLTKTDKKGRLQAGQVITVEPGIYLPGQLGVRLEDDVLVTETGGEVISRDERFDIHIDKVPQLG
ncbi:MAG TPA: Xaa-Pro peptidase family protein [Anaerohalosphaeraceae bacterium]|nr:Xaa-Pro peptidase family protein [Anaerohalosphaeraceae bacterium]HOM75365.1 Xaa-Pro peptidase family protein [Anaerohalosphaeraceae bacterium]HPC64245.1 Xaa-Pro peptidase family protein [Anaerohalosphaeraceae bacterium]HPO69349.1 Xaa-Pro peptidase family protein [Anaerohalosphaeraceae bacterium]HRS72243.1 Xaa-Pro peptidase family protein [Anaerohalosphaeraceae bacterium]